MAIIKYNGKILVHNDLIINNKWNFNNLGINWISQDFSRDTSIIRDPTFLSNGVALFGDGTSAHIFRSINNGISWSDLGKQFSQTFIPSICETTPGVVLAGTNPNGYILRSIDYGQTWNLDFSTGDLTVSDFAYCENNIVLAATGSGKIFRSTDNGINWSNLGQQFSQSQIGYIMYLENGICLAGTGNINGYILRSIDYGLNWVIDYSTGQTNIGTGTYCGNGIALNGGSGGRIFRSIDYGLNWTDLGQQFSQTNILSLSNIGGGVVLAGTGVGGLLLRSIDYGLTWTNLGQMGSTVSQVRISNRYGSSILLGTNKGLLYRSSV